MRLAGAYSFMGSLPVRADPKRLSPSGRDFTRTGLAGVGFVEDVDGADLPAGDVLDFHRPARRHVAGLHPVVDDRAVEPEARATSAWLPNISTRRSAQFMRGILACQTGVDKPPFGLYLISTNLSYHLVHGNRTPNPLPGPARARQPGAARADDRARCSTTGSSAPPTRRCCSACRRSRARPSRATAAASRSPTAPTCWRAPGTCSASTRRCASCSRTTATSPTAGSSAPNRRFGERAPLEIMKQGFEGLLAVRRYLDFERGR